MTISMYQAAVPGMTRMLTNLRAILVKAEAHAQARKIDAAVFLNGRLAADMLPLSTQVMIATDHAKGAAARLAGMEVPTFDDKATDFAGLFARIDRTLAFLGGFSAPQIDGSETRKVSLPLRDGTLELTGQAYLLDFALPNFYFHVVTTYAILRHLGVEIGKRDYIGPLR